MIIKEYWEKKGVKTIWYEYSEELIKAMQTYMGMKASQGMHKEQNGISREETERAIAGFKGEKAMLYKKKWNLEKIKLIKCLS